MNEASQLILVGIAVAFVAIERAIKIYGNITWKRNGRNRRKSSNPGIEHTPGAATACQKHGNALAEIKNELLNINRRLKKLEK